MALVHSATDFDILRRIHVASIRMGSEDGQQQDTQERVLQETLNGLSSSKEGAESAKACCVICLSEISEACTAKPCDHHNFDFVCLASWLQLKTTCPLCKSEVREIHYDFADAGANWKTFRVPKIGLERTSEGAGAAAGVAPAVLTASTHGRFRGRARLGRPCVLPTSSDPDLRARAVLARRRHVYRHNLYSLHVGSNAASRYRDVTPQHFNSDPELLSRARSWIRRELQVFEFLNNDTGRSRRQNTAEFVLEYVIAILKTVDMQESSGHAEELLSDFLGRDNCRIFLHELRNFLRSPHSVAAWDRHVQYDEPSRRRSGDLYRPADRRTTQLQSSRQPSRWRDG